MSVDTDDLPELNEIHFNWISWKKEFVRYMCTKPKDPFWTFYGQGRKKSVIIKILTF